MKKLGIIVVILILAVVGYFGYKQYKASTNSSNTQSVGNVVKGTIQDLLLTGKSVTCTVTDTAENGGTGVIFVSGKRMAGDFKVAVNGKDEESHMITDGTYSYIWSSNSKEGIKMKVDQIKTTPGAEGQPNRDSNDPFDLKKETGLKCSPWAPDNAKFTPPANINFTDYSQALQNPGKTTTQQGSPCDQIPDAAAKAECIKAISGK